MLIRRLSLLFPGLLCSSFVMAGEGFYVGAGIGKNTTSYDFHSHVFSINNETGAISEGDDISSFDASESVFVAEVSGGYQWLFLGRRMIYSLALEGFVDFKSADFKHSNSTESFGEYTTEARIGNLYGASLKPGIFVTNNMLVYLDIGAVFTRVEDIKSTYTGLTDVSPDPHSVGSFDAENLWGVRTGAGIQWLWNRQFSVDLSWSLDTFNETVTTTRYMFPVGEGASDVYEEAKIDVTHNNTFLLGLTYYFNS